MHEAQNYLKEVLGIEVRIKPLAARQTAGLPFFLRQLYAFYHGELWGRQVILLKKKTDDPPSADQLRKHGQLVEEALDCPVVFVLPFLQAYNRKRLIRKQVAFMVPGKQLFIPQLLIDLRDFRQTVPMKKERLTPAAQCLLLYHLLKEDAQFFSLKELARKLNYTQATITRAVGELVQKGLATKRINHKTVQILFGEDKKALWQKAQPFLQNPVKRVYYLEQPVPQEYVYKASFTALAYYTDLDAGGTAYFAVSQNDFNQWKKKAPLLLVPYAHAPVHLQIWKYAPGILTDARYVDPLSLYLSLKDQDDERVQKALDQLTDSIW